MDKNIFPFPKSSHRKFPRTFLVLAGFELHYDLVSLKTVESKLNSFLETEFGFDSVDNKDAFNVVTIHSDELQIEFKFEDKRVCCMLGGKMYSSFAETAIPQLLTALKYIESVVDRNEVDVKLFKVNKWGINSEDETDLYDAAKVVLRPEFLPSESDSDSLHGEVTVTEKEWCWQAEENVSVFLKRKVKKNAENSIEVTLTTMASGRNIVISEVLGLAEKMNYILFDTYMGAVTDDVIRIMEDGED